MTRSMPSLTRFVADVIAPTLACVARSQVDSKKELEKLLKATCEAFIMAVTKLTVEPMLSFLTKVTAVRVAASAPSSGAAKPLREQVRRAVAAHASELVACRSTGAVL